MRVLEVDEPRELALCVDEQQRRQRVDTGLMDAVAPGEVLLVHAGTALAREPV
jgi:hydrogenase maturation factor